MCGVGNDGKEFMTGFRKWLEEGRINHWGKYGSEKKLFAKFNVNCKIFVSYLWCIKTSSAKFFKKIAL